jgi:hypothetical protein
MVATSKLLREEYVSHYTPSCRSLSMLGFYLLGAIWRITHVTF